MATNLNLHLISVMICILPSLCVSVQVLLILLVRLYFSLPLPLRESHVKVFESCSPAVLGGCAVPERLAYILTTSFSRPSILGGCGGPDRLPTTVREFILCVLPPCLHPALGLLGVVFLLYWPPPPCPLPLMNCLPLDGLLWLCFCGLPGEGVCPEKLYLLPELLHCWTQWFFLP